MSTVNPEHSTPAPIPESLTYQELVSWICEGTTHIDAAEASEVLRRLKEATPELKMRIVRLLNE